MDCGPKDKNQRVVFLSSVGILVVTVIFGLSLRLSLLSGVFPYVVHVDEGYLAEPAKSVIVNGDWNPHFFSYPSVPIYLASLGMVAGFISAASHLEIDSVKKIGRVTYPFYQVPTIMKSARSLFAILSVVSFIFLGVAAFQAYRRINLIFLPGVLLLASSLYLEHSWRYLNVDIIGVFFVSLTYMIVFLYRDKDTYLHKAVLPGICGGLVLSSKYNLFPVLMLLPVAILFFSEQARLKKIAVSLIVSVIAFLITTPYSFLDLNTFLDHVGQQVFHYQQGHPGAEGVPGFSQFMIYVTAIGRDYGAGLSALGLLGIVFGIGANWKVTVTLLSAPVALLFFMSMQTVNFSRNVLAVYALFPIFISCGVVSLYQLCKSAFQHFQWSPRRSQFAAAAILVICMAIAFPIDKIYGTFNKQDSRNLALNWIALNVPKGAAIDIAKDLGMDVRGVTEDYKITVLDFRGAASEVLQSYATKRKGVYVLVPEYGYDKRYPNRKEHSDTVNRNLEVVKSRAVAKKGFGANPLWIAKAMWFWWEDEAFTYIPAIKGNPKFTIYQL